MASVSRAAQAGGEHRGHVALVEPGIGRVRGAPGLRPGRAAGDPFGRQHVADRLPGAGLPRAAAHVVVLRDIGDPAGVPFVGREPLRPRHAPVGVGGPGHRAVGPGVRAGQRGPGRRLRDRGGEVVPAGQIGRVRAARHPRDLLADRRVERMAVVGVERVPVRLVPDREAGQVLPVPAPDVPGGPGIGRFQVRDRRRHRVEQAQRVDDLYPGRGGEREQVVHPGEAVAAGARRDALVHRATADPQVTQAQIPDQGDERPVLRAEQVAADPRVAGDERSHLEAEAREVIRDPGPRRPGAGRDRHGRGTRPGVPPAGIGVPAPAAAQPGGPARHAQVMPCRASGLTAAPSPAGLRGARGAGQARSSAASCRALTWA